MYIITGMELIKINIVNKDYYYYWQFKLEWARRKTSPRTRAYQRVRRPRIELNIRCFIDGVSHTAYGMDIFVGKAFIDLFSQVVDIYIYNVAQAFVVHIPHMLDDHGLGYDAAFISHEIFQ